jgi:hypothetical protein
MSDTVDQPLHVGAAVNEVFMNMNYNPAVPQYGWTISEASIWHHALAYRLFVASSFWPGNIINI